AEALVDADGFVDTADMLERRGDRYYFVGRRDGIINVGGQKVHPEEVEAIINGHPRVRMSLVRTRKSPITGALVVADVVLNAEAPALLSDRESLTYRALTERANRYGGWALEHGIGTGDAVALFMPNRPEYLAIWLGVTRVGGVVALLNTNLAGSALAHCIDLVAPRHVIVAAELIAPFMPALPHLAGAATIWVHGTGHDACRPVEPDVDRRAAEPRGRADRRPPTIEDRALYIYTSGTTGLPKAASVSHFR